MWWSKKNPWISDIQIRPKINSNEKMLFGKTKKVLKYNLIILDVIIRQGQRSTVSNEITNLFTVRYSFFA